MIVNEEILRNLAVGEQIIKEGDREPSYIHLVNTVNKTVSFSEQHSIFKGDFKSEIEIKYRVIVDPPIPFKEITNGQWFYYQH